MFYCYRVFVIVSFLYKNLHRYALSLNLLLTAG